MYIWKLERIDDFVDYEQVNAMIVAADTEESARQIAANPQYGGPEVVWLSTAVTVAAIGEALGGQEAGVILTSNQGA